MSEDLIKELDSVLQPIDNTKLQSYFENSNDDDVFSNIHYNTKESSKEYNFLETKFQKSGADQSESNDRENILPQSSEVWLISESSKTMLAKIVSKEISKNNVSKELLAHPKLHTDKQQQMSDPIFSVLKEHYDDSVAAELRHIPVCKDNKFSMTELCKYLQNGWIRPAIDMTSLFLHESGFEYANSTPSEIISPPFTHKIGKIWNLRFALMMKIKLFALLESELSGFQKLDCPNLYGEFYCEDSNNTSMKGSLIPFSLRLIYAELPLYSNKFTESLNRLYYLQAIVDRILLNLKTGYCEDGTAILGDIGGSEKEKLVELWLKRKAKINTSCLKALVYCKDFQSALDLLYSSFLKSQIKSVVNLSSIYQIIGKIYLLIGNIEQATFYFDWSLKELKTRSDDNSTFELKTLVNHGFVAMAQNNYEEAKQNFRRCLELDKSHLVAINNFSVCCLYLKNVNNAISFLEEKIQEGNYNETIIFNLCIFYELQTTQVKSKKLKLMKILSRFTGDDFTFVTFKLTGNE